MLTTISTHFGHRPCRITSVLGLCAVSVITAFCFGTTVRAQDAVGASKPAIALGATSSDEPAPSTPATNSKPRSSGTSRATTETTTTEPTIVIRGDEFPSAYGAPGGLSRSRFSPITNGYVLPNGAVFAALIYEGNFAKGDAPDHMFTQEIEVGLPYRFGVAVENTLEFFNREAANKSFSVEARWALADWDKIPLNPTLFAEYKFGTGPIIHEEGPPPPPEEAEEEEGEGPPDQPDAYEFRLLLSEEIAKSVEWSFNAFLENEILGDRGREWGFAQSIQTPLFLPHERFKAGLEMEYKNFTVKDTRGSAMHSFVIGPSFAIKPSARARFDVATLFGVTKDSPDFQVFGVFSYVFGGEGGEEAGGEGPASTRNR